MKLIQTKDYLLLIDEEAEVSKTGTLIYENDTNLLNITGVDYEPQGLDSKIIAYYPLTKEAEELDLPLLPNPFEEEPLMKQASKLRELRGYHKDSHYSFCGGFIEGYKAAQSKQFSLEDMYRVAIEVSNRVSRPEYGEIININEIVDTYVQSLSTQQLPKVFIPEYKKDFTNGWSDVLQGGDGKPKLKTTTNSEGKQVLVGTYKY